MTIRHFFGREDWYGYTCDRGAEERGIAPWRAKGAWLHFPNGKASAEWSVFGKHGFGWGFQLGRNGGESDLGLNLYAGRLASLWLRVHAPWTKWARITKERDPEHWYYARHYGVRIHPRDACYLSGEWGSLDGRWSKGDPWWRDWSITKHSILGKTHHETTTTDSGVAQIPLPEGVYVGTWKKQESVTSYVRFPGTVRDRILGQRRRRSFDIRIDGGIPVEGKGENSWDCGMDGLFGTGGATLPEAIANCVRSVLRDRERYGGPHDLERPMTVQEAEARHAS